MSQIASVVAVGFILAYRGILFVKEDDTQVIQQFMELSWKRASLYGSKPQPLLDWACWCKAGMQLGEWDICPPR